MRWIALALLLFMARGALGQVRYEVDSFELSNGAEVSYQMWGDLETVDGGTFLGRADSSGNVIYRKLDNADGTPWLGFEVHFDRVESSRFRIWFAPIEGYPFFERAPETRQIRDGDRVLFDVLEQPSTHTKIFDSFQVYLPDRPHADLPLFFVHSLPGIIPKGTLLCLARTRISFSTYEALPMLEDTTALSGRQVDLDLPNGGQISFSSEAGNGYRLEAVAEGTQLRFVTDGDTYSVLSDKPVVPLPGAWLLWVRFAPPANPTVLSPWRPQPGPSPVAIKPVGSPESSDSPLSLALENICDQPIVAYTIDIHFPPSVQGKRGRRHVRTVLRVHDDGTINPLEPGQTAILAIKIPQNTEPFPANRVTAVADLVVFADGTMWGPASTFPAQLQMKAFRESLAYGRKEADP